MFSLPELQLIRAGLDIITIRGADAKLLAQLQSKVEDCLNEFVDIPPTNNPKATKK